MRTSRDGLFAVTARAWHFLKPIKRPVFAQSEYARIKDPDILEATYGEARSYVETIPYVSRKGLETIIAELAPSEAKAKQAKPDDFVDHRFVTSWRRKDFSKTWRRSKSWLVRITRRIEVMPNVKLPTGVDLYYESHGQGEPLIFVPSTAFSGEVWKPSQMPLAQSLNIVFHHPRGCGRSIASSKRLHHRADGRRYRRANGSSENFLGPSSGSLHGRADCALSHTKFTGTGKELDHGRQRLRPCGAVLGSDFVAGLLHRLVGRHGGDGVEKYVGHVVCDSDTFLRRIIVTAMATK